MPRINLIPWREAERKRKRQEFGVGAVAALALAGVISFAVNLQMQGAVSDQNERNQYLRDEIARLDKQIAEIQQLDQQKQRLLARMQVIEQLERSRPEVVHLFDQLVRTLPDGVYLTAVKQNDRKVQLKGIAQSSTRRHRARAVRGRRLQPRHPARAGRKPRLPPGRPEDRHPGRAEIKHPPGRAVQRGRAGAGYRSETEGAGGRVFLALGPHGHG